MLRDPRGNSKSVWSSLREGLGHAGAQGVCRATEELGCDSHPGEM